MMISLIEGLLDNADVDDVNDWLKDVRAFFF